MAEIPDYNDAVRAFARKMARRTWTLRSSAKNTRIFIRTTACTCWAAFTRFGVPELIAEVYDDVFALESNESAAE
ncbi:MAG: hypothetical protein ACLU3I_19445 [Acutalibacteraceae bacterium]